jgi:MFS superfamily sulfate permease-like transporter
MIGIGVGLLFILRSNFRPTSAVTVSGTNYLVRFRRDASFLNKPIIKRQLEEIPPDSSVIIDLRRADFIDADVLEVIEDFCKAAPLKQIKIEIKQSIYKTPLIQTTTK